MNHAFFSDGRFTPCSVDQQGAFVVKLSDLPPDKVSIMVVIQSVSRGSMTNFPFLQWWDS